MFAPRDSRVFATAMNSSSLAPTTLPMIFFGARARVQERGETVRPAAILEVLGSSPRCCHDLKPGRRDAPRRARRSRHARQIARPTHSCIEEAISTPPNRIEVRSMLLPTANGDGRTMTAMFANAGPANFEGEEATMKDASIRPRAWRR